MDKRTKHIKTEYETARKEHRAKASRHVIVLESDMSENEKRHAFSMADGIRQAENTVKGVFQKRIDQLVRTKAYRRLLSDYFFSLKKLKGLEEGTPAYEKWAKQKKTTLDSMEKMQKEFHISKPDVVNEMQIVRGKNDLNSVFCLSAAESVWQGVEKILFGNGRRLHFKKRGDLPILKAKQAHKAIIVKIKEGKFRFSVKGLKDFGVIVDPKDRFINDEIAKILEFYSNAEDNEYKAVQHYLDTGEVGNTFRICYASLKCVEMRGKLRVFVHLTIEGKACPKYKKDGSRRYDFSKEGIVGSDIGTQSVAAVSDSSVLLENLAERHYVSTKVYEAKEAELLQKMDRSRRATNPDNFNADGTIKPKKDRKPWVYSKAYRRYQQQYRDMARRNAASRKYANRELANRIRSMGDFLVTEPKNAEKLKRKAKKSHIIENKDGTKTWSSRKRFGHSIQNRCPGGLQAELKKKFGEDHYIEVPNSYKASQFDHTIGDNGGCVQKELDDRMVILSDGTKVQRDMYSAFLMHNPSGDMKTPDVVACRNNFAGFFELMNKRIYEIAISNHPVCNSGIEHIDIAA